MGHTVWSQRIVIDMLLKELSQYGKSLRQEDRTAYEELLKKPLKHIGNISYTSSIHVWAFLLLSIVLEQQKHIKELEDSYESLAHGRVQEQELDCAVDKNPAQQHPDQAAV